MENGTGLVATGSGALGAGAFDFVGGVVLTSALAGSVAAFGRLLPKGNPS